MTVLVSPFLEIPAAEWFASNAFAIRNRYPVSPGHTLVITQRLVEDSFAATRVSDDERVMELDAASEKR